MFVAHTATKVPTGPLMTGGIDTGVAARVEVNGEPRHNLWYSGTHHAFGRNVQVLADPTGFLLWVSSVRPGSTHDLTAARELVLLALYPHAANDLSVLADKD